MTEFIVHSRSGEPVLRTSSPEEAGRYQLILGGQITGGGDQA